MSNVISIVVTKSKNSPERKITSATFSKRSLFDFLLRIDRKESTLLIINMTMATEVNSSIIVFPFRLSTLKDVRTIKQNPNRLEEVFKMWGDLSFLFSIIIDFFNEKTYV